MALGFTARDAEGMTKEAAVVVTLLALPALALAVLTAMGERRRGAGVLVAVCAGGCFRWPGRLGTSETVSAQLRSFRVRPDPHNASRANPMVD